MAKARLESDFMPASPGLGNREPEKLCILPRATQQEGQEAGLTNASLSPHLSSQAPAVTH